MKVLNDLLGYENVRIYQDDDYFKFSVDGVLLANFVVLRLTDKKILDIGSGTGIVSLILSIKNNKLIDAIDIQPELCELFRETIHYNLMDDKINLIVILKRKNYLISMMLLFLILLIILVSLIKQRNCQ